MIKILLAITILSSCSTVSTIPTFTQGSGNTFVEGKTEFVELKDGKIVEGKIDKLQWLGDKPLIQSSKFTVNGTPYRGKEINALQSKNKYFRKTVYNDFAERIIKGKINVYRFEKQTGATNAKGRFIDYTLYYLQKGENEPLEEYDSKLMEKTIGDNTAALAEFKDYKKLSNKEKMRDGGSYLTEIIERYNKEK